VGPVNQSPNTAIYEGADDWRYKDGTKLKGKVILPDGTEILMTHKRQYLMKCITLSQENVQNVKDFMMSRNVPLYVL
jgi:hypothetical protein